MVKVVLTGFEPFAGFPTNPTQTLVEMVEVPAGMHLVRLVLPVVIGECAPSLLRVIDVEKPAAVMSLGLAANRQTIALERIALNCHDFQTPDNAGHIHRATPIVPHGALALPTTLPLRAMEAALRAEAIPVEISYSAGTYVCNHLFYAVQYELLRCGIACRYGFVHMPPTPELAAHGMPLAMQYRAIIRLLETLRDTDETDNVWPLQATPIA